MHLAAGGGGETWKKIGEKDPRTEQTSKNIADKSNQGLISLKNGGKGVLISRRHGVGGLEGNVQRVGGQNKRVKAYQKTGGKMNTARKKGGVGKGRDIQES